MSQKSRFALALAHAGQGAVLATLCVTLVAPPAVFAAGTATASAPLTESQRISHALNRFTFGPRPGDEAAVRQMGLDRWFAQQLHPERIDDAKLEARLAQYPAMRLSQERLLARFPAPGVLRQMQKGAGQFEMELPGDPVEKAIYADAERNYSLKLDQLQAGQAKGAATGAGDAMAAGDELMADGAMKAQPQTAIPQMEPAAAAKKGKAAARKALGSDAPQDVEAILAEPPQQRFDALVAMTPDQMIEFRNGLKGVDQLRLFAGFTPEQTESVAAMQGPVRVVAAEALESRLVRDVYSDRQLEAVMTDFWLNHFSVYVRKNQNEPYYLPDYLSQTVLPHAMGSFEDLLVATAKSPAMLVYLDNWESIGPHSMAAQRIGQIARVRPNGVLAKQAPKGINENYARELMELHTLGVGGGYTQQDVIEVAKCFTGWTIDRPAQGGGFAFEPNRHEPGDKTVLGQTIHEGGMNEGLQVLHLLATNPATARFISHKLAVRFVSDQPPAATEQAMTDAYVKSGGDIRAVLTAMYKSPGFWSPEVYHAKVKTPLEFLVSALRASDADVNNAVPLVQAMQRLGMPVYGMQTPNGYSWTSEEWVSSNALLTRMNFALVLAGDRLPGTRLDWTKSLGTDAAATPATEAKLESVLLGQAAAARTRSTVLERAGNPNAQREAERNFNAKPGDADLGGEEMAPNGGGMMKVNAKRGGGRGFGPGAGPSNSPETPLGTMAGLLLGSPDFQRR